MPQLRELSEIAYKQLGEAGELSRSWSTMSELEQAANSAAARLLLLRGEAAQADGVISFVKDTFDKAVRTNKSELLDRDDVPDHIKQRIVSALHVQNIIFRSYNRFLSVLEPLITEVSRRLGRQARVLELASGSGEFALELGRLSRKRDLNVAITGSDIVKAYVDRGDQLARKRRISVSFRVLNAFDMRDVADGAFDIVFIAQSIHHFTPGQIAMMIAQSHRIATTAFVGIDGKRALSLLFGLPTFAATTLQYPLFHDAFISARRLYSDAELAVAAELGAPKVWRRIRSMTPFTVLTLRFDRPAGADGPV